MLFPLALSCPTTLSPCFSVTITEFLSIHKLARLRAAETYPPPLFRKSKITLLIFLALISSAYLLAKLPVFSSKRATFNIATSPFIFNSTLGLSILARTTENSFSLSPRNTVILTVVPSSPLIFWLISPTFSFVTSSSLTLVTISPAIIPALIAELFFRVRITVGKFLRLPSSTPIPAPTSPLRFLEKSSDSSLFKYVV
ncbi:Uncharacterised protein [Chlamydia trachomatis]|nr:Uncharacterised protein [Chlamydia trachomatis]